MTAKHRPSSRLPDVYGIFAAISATILPQTTGSFSIMICRRINTRAYHGALNLGDIAV